MDLVRGQGIVLQQVDKPLQGADGASQVVTDDGEQFVFDRVQVFELFVLPDDLVIAGIQQGIEPSFLRIAAQQEKGPESQQDGAANQQPGIDTGPGDLLPLDLAVLVEEIDLVLLAFQFIVRLETTDLLFFLVCIEAVGQRDLRVAGAIYLMNNAILRLDQGSGR